MWLSRNGEQGRAPGRPGWDDSLQQERRPRNYRRARVWVSQFSANKLGNKRVRESQDTEPQISARTLKTIAPEYEAAQPTLRHPVSLASKYPAMRRFSMIIVGQCLWPDKREVSCDAVVVYFPIDGRP